MQFKRKVYYFLLVVFMPIEKEPACSARDLGSIPGLGRSPGEGSGYPLQYSCLENFINWEARRATVHGMLRVGHDWAANTYAHLL